MLHHPFVCDLRANPVQLPQLDEDEVEVYPLQTSVSYTGHVIQGRGDDLSVNYDSLEIFMFGCDCFE